MYRHSFHGDHDISLQTTVYLVFTIYVTADASQQQLYAF